MEIKLDLVISKVDFNGSFLNILRMGAPHTSQSIATDLIWLGLWAIKEEMVLDVPTKDVYLVPLSKLKEFKN